MVRMDNEALTYREFAEYARLPIEKLAEQCEVQVFRATGPGGQGVNTTDSAVRTTHVPTGIVVVSRESRSQYRNRQMCLQKIREELERRGRPPKVRHKTKPTRASKERRLASKRFRSQVKQLRRRPRDE